MLAKSNIKLPLIYGILVCCLAYISLQLILASVYTALSFYMPQIDGDTLYMMIGNVMNVASTFIMSPLLLGFYDLAIRLTRGQNPDFATIFKYFSSPKLLMRSWLTLIITFLPLILATIALRAVDLLSASLLSDALLPQSLQLAVSVLAAPILSLVAFWVAGRFYTLINIIVCGGKQSFSVCLEKALCSTRKKAGEIFLFRISFLPWILLSIGTFGVLFVIFTLPYMAIAYSQYSSYLITSEYRINYLGDKTQ